jgi:hypothetical protein
LKYGRDPIAVPYVRAVLAKTTHVDWILFEGLVRIGGVEARQALTNAAKETGERAKLATAALMRLKTTPFQLGEVYAASRGG